MVTSRARVTASSRRTGAIAALVALAFGAAGSLVTTATAATPVATATAAPARPVVANGGDATVTGALASFYQPPRPLAYAPAGTVIRSRREPVPGSAGRDPGLPHPLPHHLGVGRRPGGVRPRRRPRRTARRPEASPSSAGPTERPAWRQDARPSVGGTATVPDLAALIAAREIVVAADYRGLGAPGAHPYLVGDSEAEDVLDGARAARSLLGAGRLQRRRGARLLPGRPGGAVRRGDRPDLRPGAVPRRRGRRRPGDVGTRAGTVRRPTAAVGPVRLHRHGPLRLGPPLPHLHTGIGAHPGRTGRTHRRVDLVHQRGGLAVRRGGSHPVLPPRMAAGSCGPRRQPGQPAGRCTDVGAHPGGPGHGGRGRPLRADHRLRGRPALPGPVRHGGLPGRTRRRAQPGAGQCRHAASTAGSAPASPADR